MIGPEPLVAPEAPKGFLAWLEQPHVKWAVPLPLLLALAPLIWLFFRSTWKELEREAVTYRARLREAGSEVDYRPLVALAMGAVILTLQEYYGGSNQAFYQTVVVDNLHKYEAKHPGGFVNFARYEELYRLIFWAVTRIGGYLAPLVVWRAIFWKDSLLDFGLRTKGFLEHAWIYAMFVAIMIPVMITVAKQPDFGTYYPFYKAASRSWLDFGMWEVFYIGQFFALEVFFRGWWVRACRGFGAGAILCMVVPYCMIHYGKPYLEACGAIVAGTVLGSLSMKTRSIYAGFLVHITVAILMDFLALHHRHALPERLSPTSQGTFVFKYTVHTLWAVWALAFLLLVVTLVRRWPALRAELQRRRAAAG